MKEGAAEVDWPDLLAFVLFTYSSASSNRRRLAVLLIVGLKHWQLFVILWYCLQKLAIWNTSHHTSRPLKLPSICTKDFLLLCSSLTWGVSRTIPNILCFMYSQVPILWPAHLPSRRFTPSSFQDSCQGNPQVEDHNQPTSPFPT